MQGRKSSPVPNPFHYQQAPLYPEDFKARPQAGLTAPWHSHHEGNDVEFALHHAVAPKPIPVAARNQEQTPTNQPGSWQPPSQDAYLGRAWHVDSNKKGSLPYAQEVRAVPSESQFPPWQNTSVFYGNEPYRSQGPAHELDAHFNAFPYPPFGNYGPYHAFGLSDNALLYDNKSREAQMGVYQRFSAGSMDTLVGTSPADVFTSSRMAWTEAIPRPMQTSGTNSTCSPNQYHTTSPGSLKGFDAFQQHNLSGSDQMPIHSPSMASDRTVTASLDSGATPLALVAPLSDVESCLFSEAAPMHVKFEDPEEGLVDSPGSIVGDGEGRTPVHEGSEEKHFAQKRTHDEVRYRNPSTETSVELSLTAYLFRSRRARHSRPGSRRRERRRTNPQTLLTCLSRRQAAP